MFKKVFKNVFTLYILKALSGADSILEIQLRHQLYTYLDKIADLVKLT